VQSDIKGRGRPPAIVVRCLGLDWLEPSLMLRTCPRVIALALMLIGLPTAQAADTTLTLACKGTQTTSQDGAPKSSEVINIGIIVDLQKKTVVGFEPTVTLTIDSLTETTISFSGGAGGWFANGILDRVTGSLVAASSRSKGPTTSHDLLCRPAQRMF
jgi:hypothetical protein